MLYHLYIICISVYSKRFNWLQFNGERTRSTNLWFKYCCDQNGLTAVQTTGWWLNLKWFRTLDRKVSHQFTKPNIRENTVLVLIICTRNIEYFESLKFERKHINQQNLKYTYKYYSQYTLYPITAIKLMDTIPVYKTKTIAIMITNDMHYSDNRLLIIIF